MSGPIAEAERLLMLQAFGLMLVVVVPVIVLTLAFAWRYRATNERAAYRPEWERSPVIEAVVWGIPAIMILILGTMVWKNTHALDPYRPLSGGEPIQIEAIALDWKWLFVYPEDGIAAVNELAIPAGRPVTFRITSDVAMNSFIIPALGGQIYAMAGMVTRLNLKADGPGRMQGRNMQFSGAGFPEQTFAVLALSNADFDAWTAEARAGGVALDEATFSELARPASGATVSRYSSVADGFFDGVVARHAAMPHHDAPKGAGQ